MWKLPELDVRAVAHVDADLIFVSQDANQKLNPPLGIYATQVKRFKQGGTLRTEFKSTDLFCFSGKKGATHLLVVGFGLPDQVTEEKMRILGALSYAKLSQEKIRSVRIQIDTFGDKLKESACPLMAAFAEGLVLSSYQYPKYFTKKKKPFHLKVSFSSRNQENLEWLKKEIPDLLVIGEAVNCVRDWGNEPSNIGTPEFFAAEARRYARRFGLKYKVLTEKDAAREKMNLFLGVGKGSERPGRVVVLEYVPKGVKNPKTIVLVGKGITFDSGGISLKPSTHMEEMKFDMGGAATVFGATILAVQRKVTKRIVTIMAFTENMPGGRALQPGNIIVSRSGKTVEVANTDAEGRLILADMLDYAHQFKPDAIVDAATLTGAVTVALGKYCCALLGNDENLIKTIQKAGESQGERLWQLPLYEEYFDDMKSDYADMKNIGNNSAGGTIRGAIFLRQFVKPKMAWAHLDIAATAWDLGYLPYFPKKGASGAYVRTLARFIAEY